MKQFDSLADAQTFAVPASDTITTFHGATRRFALAAAAVAAIAAASGCSLGAVQSPSSVPVSGLSAQEQAAQCAAAEKAHQQMSEHDMEGTEMEAEMMKQHGRLCHPGDAS